MGMPARGVAAFGVARRFVSASIIRCRSASLVEVQPNFRLPPVSSMRRAKQCRIRQAVCRRATVTRVSRSKARLRPVSIRRRFMAKPCTPHLHCAARAVIQATNCQCRGSRGPPLAFSWGVKGAILSRERMAPFAASPHGVGINPKKYHFLNFLIVSAMIFCFKIMLTST